MNPTTLEAIKLFLEMQNNTLVTDEQKKQTLLMLDKLLMIMEKDVQQAYEKYASIKLYRI